MEFQKAAPKSNVTNSVLSKVSFASSWLLAFAIGSSDSDNLTQPNEPRSVSSLALAELDFEQVNFSFQRSINFLELPADENRASSLAQSLEKLDLDLTQFGFDRAIKIHIRNHESVAQLKEIVDASYIDPKDIPPFPAAFLMAHYQVLNTGQKLQANYPELAVALADLRQLGFQAIRSAEEFQEKSFDTFIQKRNEIALKHGFLASLGLGIPEGQDIHSKAGIVVTGELEVTYNGDTTKILFVSEPEISARGYTFRDSAVINLAKADISTEKGLARLRVTIVDEIAHVYLAKYLDYDTYLKLPWDTTQDGRPEAPEFVRSETLKKSLAELPVKEHQKLEELISFAWSVRADAAHAFEGGIKNLLAVDGKSESQKAKDDRYYLIIRLTDIGLKAINQNRTTDLEIEKATLPLIKKRDAIRDVSTQLAKQEVVRFSLRRFAEKAHESLQPIKEFLLAEIPTIDDAVSKLGAIKMDLDKDDWPAADRFLEDYKVTLKNLLQFNDSVESIRFLVSENSDQILREQGDKLEKEWSALLSKQTEDLLRNLSADEKKQLSDLIISFSNHYENRIKEHYERN